MNPYHFMMLLVIRQATISNSVFDTVQTSLHVVCVCVCVWCLCVCACVCVRACDLLVKETFPLTVSALAAIKGRKK